MKWWVEANDLLVSHKLKKAASPQGFAAFLFFTIDIDLPSEGKEFGRKYYPGGHCNARLPMI